MCAMVKSRVPLLGVSRDGHPPGIRNDHYNDSRWEFMTMGHTRTFAHGSYVGVNLNWVAEPLVDIIIRWGCMSTIHFSGGHDFFLVGLDSQNGGCLLTFLSNQHGVPLKKDTPI